MKYYIVALFSVISVHAISQNHIFIDGNFDDWDGIAPVCADKINDQISGQIDLGKLWMVNDEDHLYIRLETGQEINFQNDQTLTLYIDTDNDKTTGMQIRNMGADIKWSFGDRKGTYYSGSGDMTIYHRHIGFSTAPTVTSDQFEMLFDRHAMPNGSNNLFTSNEIGLFFEIESGIDYLPDTESVSYTFNLDPIPALENIDIGKETGQTFRIMAYNVLRDNLFESGLSDPYKRIFQAIQPDIIGFEEIYKHSSYETRKLINSFIPANWHAARIDPDIVIVSKYSVLDSFSIEGNAAFLLDLLPDYNSKMLVIVAHPPCCNNEADRQYEIDAIMAFVREAKSKGGILDLDANTPVVIMGDMNLVGLSQQLNTFITGNIVNTNDFGNSFQPDWDGSSLEDLNPRHAESVDHFTWYSESSTYWPGRLDFMFYTGSVLSAKKAFVLYTPELSSSTLNNHNLKKSDVIDASDHLPVIADFTLKSSGTGSLEPYEPLKFHPNPARDKIYIEQGDKIFRECKIKIFNSLGEMIMFKPHFSAEIDIETLSPGFYQLVITGDRSFATAFVKY